MTSGMVVQAFSNLTFSMSDVEFTLTVPEPAAVGLLVPAALHILSSRCRRGRSGQLRPLNSIDRPSA